MAQYYYSKRDKSLGITWEKLDQYICKNTQLCQTTLKQQEFMDKMFLRLPNSQSDTPQKGNLYISAFAPSGNLDSSSIKKYSGYVYHAKDLSFSRFINIREHFLNQSNKSLESWDYKTHPDILAFKAVWEELIPSSASAEYNECLENAIGDILLDIPKNNLLIKERLSDLTANHEYSLTLAILSVIASTLFCFGCGDEQPLSEDDYKLHALVLPPVPKQEESSELKKARIFAEKEARTLDELKAEALDELVQKLELPLNNKMEQGDAYYLLAWFAYKINKKQDLTDKQHTDINRKFDNYLKNAIRYGSRKAIQLNNEKKAVELLNQARTVFNGANQTDINTVKKCCNNCLQILSFSPSVDAKFRGEASYILYKYIRLGLFISPSGETSQDYLGLSHRLGYPMAKDDWSASNTFSIDPQFERATVESNGICYANAKNIISETFSKTVPESWRTKDDFISEYNIESVAERIYDNCYFRFLFIDDNYRKNLQDFFALMQLIKESSLESVENFEIFLRHEFETAKPLVDTALNHLSDYQIAVYILDDDKQAAQQLLSFHPLFYPVKSVDFNLLNKQAEQTNKQTSSKNSNTMFKRPILNFIILGNTRVAEWLVREAFWMMGFKNNLIENRITILSNDGVAFETKIKSKYPGMVNGNLEIDGVDFPVIKGINVNYNSPALSQEINTLLDISRYNYFAVATESDEENLSLAMKVRELLIRNYVSNSRSQDLMISPPVAFLCRDDYLSWISKELVVEEENEGDRWFNTWNLIPFGEISRCYSFNNITGGTFEKLARCIHYQYNNVSSEEVFKKTPEGTYMHTENFKKATKDYYLRQYNQDSSYSSALSMPYRIFQFQDYAGNQIMPSAWSICQTTVFSSVNQLKALSTRLNNFKNKSKREAQEQAVAEWEHARWVKWMISRGWMPAKIDEVVFAIEKGNPRQQLFVAKLHPCICSYKDLKILQNALLTRCNMKKDFFTYDLMNIQDTDKLLALEWIQSMPKDFEKNL